MSRAIRFAQKGDAHADIKGHVISAWNISARFSTIATTRPPPSERIPPRGKNRQYPVFSSISRKQIQFFPAISGSDKTPIFEARRIIVYSVALLIDNGTGHLANATVRAEQVARLKILSIQRQSSRAGNAYPFDYSDPS